MANHHTPWTAYRAMIDGRLIGLEKYLRVSSVEVGYICLCCMYKCVLEVSGLEAQEVCGTNHLCGGVEERIEGKIHAMRMLWQQNYQEEDCWSSLISTHNAFK